MSGIDSKAFESIHNPQAVRPKSRISLVSTLSSSLAFLTIPCSRQHHGPGGSFSITHDGGSYQPETLEEPLEEQLRACGCNIVLKPCGLGKSGGRSDGGAGHGEGGRGKSPPGQRQFTHIYFAADADHFDNMALQTQASAFPARNRPGYDLR